MAQRGFPALLIILVLCSRFPAAAVESPSPAPEISIRVYELTDYIRHPRMEEEDRLRGGSAAYRPGLEIISSLDNVEIRFFDEIVGYTPFERDNLSAGAYRVRMERSGYKTVEFNVPVRSDRRTVVFVNMAASEGRLILRNLPEGAEVSLDRKPVEERDLTLQSGPHTLKVAAFGRYPVSETISIMPDETLEWTYLATQTAFELSPPLVKPPTLPSGDRRGFRIGWTSTGPGSADIRIFDPEGVEIRAIPFGISAPSGSVAWKPLALDGSELKDGEYRLVVAGTGYDNRQDSAESTLKIDNRFSRSPRPASGAIPGLMYAPGSSMLPPGIWQVSTGAGYRGRGLVPAYVGIRISPAARWELSGLFGMRTRDPFEETSLVFSASGSWRINRFSGPLSSNLTILYHHNGLARSLTDIPESGAELMLPGLQLGLPSEYALGDLKLVFGPALQMFFIGSNRSDYRLSNPPSLAATAYLGTYWENGRYLLGISTAVRSQDFSGRMLDAGLWSGVDARLDLPGEGSFLAVRGGVSCLNRDPDWTVILEFGVVR